MVQKTQKVCIGTLQAHEKFQHNWIKFEILIFDPCFKKHTSIFLGHPLGSKHFRMSIVTMN